MKHLPLVLMLIAGALLAGCASVPMAPESLDAQAKTFTPIPGQANIYVVRGGGIGTALAFQVVLDGRIVGSLAPHTFVLVSVPPGEHVVEVTGAENVQQQRLVTEAGRNYFFKMSVHMGWASGRPHLEPMSDADGRSEVSAQKLAEAAN